MSEDKSLSDLMDAFEERMKKKREAEEKAEADKAEKLRQEFMKHKIVRRRGM